MIVVPFPNSQSNPMPYNYDGTCEHVLLQQCSLKHEFTINAEHNLNDLSISRLAVRLNNSYIVVNANDLTYTTTGFVMAESIAYNSKLYDESVKVTFSNDTSFFEINILSLGIVVELLLTDANDSVTLNATSYNGVSNICGLCGTIEGVLLYSDKVTPLNTRNSKLIQDFSRSWLVNPEDRITGASRPECSKFRAITVIVLFYVVF